jgi:AraC-like DNA-binding protein
MPLPARYPLQGFRQWEVHSLTEAREHSLRNFPRLLDLQPLPGSSEFHLRDATVMLGDLKLMCVSSTGHRIRLLDDERVGVLSPVRGSIAVDNGRGDAAIRPGELLIPGLGSRSTTVSAGYVGLVLLIPRACVETQLLAAGTARASRGLERLRRLDSHGGAARSLRDYLGFLVNELDRGGTLARLPAARRSASALLVDHLAALMMEYDPISETAGVRLEPWQLARAEALIEARLAEPLTVAGIASAVGTSTRTLQQAFQQHRGITPREFIQNLRLGLLHRRLCHAEPPASVSDIALDCGFAHLGRCARRYRERFGESPRQTLARALGGR